MDRIARLTFLLLLAFCGSFARADTAPAFTAYVCVTPETTDPYSLASSRRASSALAAGQAYASAVLAGTSTRNFSVQTWALTTSGTTGQVNFESYVTLSGTWSARSCWVKPLYYCPTGTLSGTTCTYTCPSGESLDPATGLCRTTCPSSGTQVLGPNTVREAGNGLTNVVCLAGCEASALMAARQDGKNYVWGPIRATGRACSQVSPSPASATETSPQCSVGQCPGTINGQTICVPCAETQQTQSASSAASSATTASGASSSTTTTESGSQSSQTTCSGGSCTTTTTSTTTAPNGDKVDKTTTKTETQGDYCAQNPNALVCKGTQSTWGGTCQAFTCDGDAVQCAQARGAWDLACGLKTEATNPTVQAGTDAIARTGEAALKDQLGMNTSQVFDLASRLDSTSLFGTPGACPSDTTLSLGIGSVTLPFASMCPQLNLVGVAMMGLAYLIAAFIVFRPVKGS